MYLKAHSKLSTNGLVVRLWFQKSSVCCSKPSRAAYCNSVSSNL